MDARLRFEYDREGDILTISTKPPYKEQESEEIGDDVIVRLNPDTGDVEHVELLFFSTRLLRGTLVDLPLTAELRLAQRS
ncbi:MAG: DUF2283 domain-containing protein [Dehalococcoidia bacterium]